MKRYNVRPSVRPHACPSLCAHSNNPAATGLLLWARRAEDNIDRLLGQHLSVGECGQSHVVSVRRKLFTDLLTCLVIVFCYLIVLRTVSFWQLRQNIVVFYERSEDDDVFRKDVYH